MQLSSQITLVNSLIGGLLIGVASSGLLLANGQIAGISGIIKNIKWPTGKTWTDTTWRLLFLLGLVMGGIVGARIFPTMAPGEINLSLGLAIFSGFIVGLGTSIGNGCTSGHGVCGLSRRSLRSFIATLTFIIFGMVTRFLMNFFN